MLSHLMKHLAINDQNGLLLQYYIDSELFTSKSSIRKWAVISAQQTKMWNKEINNLLRLDLELFTLILMTASFRQKKKKQLIIKLRVRQLKQKQKQKQRNNMISTTGQSGRGMRIK